MTKLDAVLAVLALAALIAFIGVIGWMVGEPDLIIVFVIGGGLAAWDFWASFRSRRNNNRAER
jgi:hypothetical protein